MKPKWAAMAVAVLLAIPGGTSAAPSTEALLKTIRLPEGFSIHVFADNVPNARSLTAAPDGTVFVGTRRKGTVTALKDTDGDGRADRRHIIARDLSTPNGVAFRQGALYVAEISRVLRFDAILEHLDRPPPPQVVFDGFPADRHHGWKFIAFGPDGGLYVPVGAPCNVCLRDNPIYAAITRLDPDGGDPQIVAGGVRNSVGFDWHPETGELWFTDNGRDWLGDDRPPDELNRLAVPGGHFGFPYCHGGDLPDPSYGHLRPCDDFTPPARKLGAHVAALGMRFYTGTRFPPQYRHRIFIAEHGSWNRSQKSGYRITTVTLEGQRATTYEPFAVGWLEGQHNWGRPVDLLVTAEGDLLVSDDHHGAIYRITFASAGN